MRASRWKRTKREHHRREWAEALATSAICVVGALFASFRISADFGSSAGFWITFAVLLFGVGATALFISRRGRSPMEFSVGAEGALLPEELIVWPEVESVEARADHVELTPRAGSTFVTRRIHVADPSALHTAMTQWLESSRTRSPSQPHEELSLRSETLLERSTRLRNLAKRVGYRDGSVDPDRLASIACDPSAERDQRLAAALVLADAEPRLKARVRIAIDQVADEELAEELANCLGASDAVLTRDE